MNPLLRIPLRMLLCVASALALASLAFATPAAAQPTYRCVDKDGHAVIGKYTPGVPPSAGCREDAIPVPKAILSQPVTQKNVEAIKQYLNQRIADLASREARCRAGHETVEVIEEDALDAIDSLNDNRRNSRVSRGERRVAGKIEEVAKQAHVSIQQCVQKAQADIVQVKAILSSPEGLRAEGPELLAALKRDHQLAEARREAEAKEAAERQVAEGQARERRREAALHAEQERRAAAERLSEGLRGQWLTLLENARGAHEVFASGASYDAFSLRSEPLASRIQSIRVKYARQLQMGDHETLGMAVYTACAALSAANPDWQKRRRAASTLTMSQATAERYRSIRRPSALDRANAGESEKRLRNVQQDYEVAKNQLAAQRESVARLMSEAVRVAKEEREQAHQVSVEARTRR